MHDRASSFAGLRLALALTLAVSSGCQDASHGSVDRSASPLCAECTPRAGGETSDFGAACFVDCGKRHPDRTPTPEEESVYMLERVREIERTGLSLPIAWVNWDDTEPPSRTPPSTLSARLEILQPPQIAGSDKCETTLYFPIRVTLETSDGALKASLTGSMYSRGDLLWHGEARVDLRDLNAGVDLRLRDAWAEADGKGERYGELALSLEISQDWLSGEIAAEVGFAEYPDGISGNSALPGSTSAPIVGYFPFNHCSRMRGIPVYPDQPLAKAGGKTGAELVQALQGQFDAHCARRFPARWRDGEPVEAVLELQPFVAHELCRWDSADGVLLSWAAEGRLGSAGGRLHGEIRRVEALLQGDGFGALSLETGPAARGDAKVYATCQLDPDGIPELGTWQGSVSLDENGGTRACLAFPTSQECGPYDANGDGR